MASEATIKTAEKVLGIAAIGGDAGGHGMQPTPFLILKFYKDGSIITDKDFSPEARPENSTELLTLLGCVRLTLRDVEDMARAILTRTHQGLMTTKSFLEGFRPKGEPS